jgi:hypothetical protein
VPHTCNPSYSGGSDLEDRSLKPAWGNSSRDLEKPHHKKRAGRVAKDAGSVFKLQHCKKKKLSLFCPFVQPWKDCKIKPLKT